MPISRRLFLFSFCFFRRIKTSIFIAVVATFFSDIILATSTHTTTTRTTKMPSDEQQLAEPLLDDGGNDRFVLFPLKYDAVWEMVRLSYDIISSIFKNLSVFEAFEICACADVLSSLSLSLSSYYQLQYKKAQASFWTAGTFYFFFSFVLVSVLL